jgi:transketolase N-terminal domain/subunit
MIDIDSVTHIPSALSQLKYIDYLFTNKVVVPYSHRIIIGKPFGSIAYYIAWYKNGYIDRLDYNNILKADDFDFVDFSDEVVGNALGIANGMCLVQNKLTWVNVSDSILQTGVFYEGIQFAGLHKQNIKLTIDYNRTQLTGKLRTDLKTSVNLFRNLGWTVYVVRNDFDVFDSGFVVEGPVVFFIMTHKGIGGIDPIEEHYMVRQENKERSLEIFRKVLDEKNIS